MVEPRAEPRRSEPPSGRLQRSSPRCSCNSSSWSRRCSSRWSSIRCEPGTV